MPLTPSDPPPDDRRALIPRDVLPAAVPPVARLHRRVVARSDPARQLSIFGVESVDASPADLAGLLAGPGQLNRMGGTARVSVQVDAAWRVHALLPELTARGLEAGWHRIDPDTAEHPGFSDLQAEAVEITEDGRADDPAEIETEEPAGVPVEPAAADRAAADRAAADRATEADDQGDPDDQGDGVTTVTAGSPGPGAAVFEVRTAYSVLLSGLARAWLDGTTKRTPARFFLTGPRLRLWVMAAGSPHPAGYVLRLGPGDGPHGWSAADAALTRAGLPGVVTDLGPDGPGYRITGRRRLTRLAELVGDRPPAAPPGVWPGA